MHLYYIVIKWEISTSDNNHVDLNVKISSNAPYKYIYNLIAVRFFGINLDGYFEKHYHVTERNFEITITIETQQKGSHCCEYYV